VSSVLAEKSRKIRGFWLVIGLLQCATPTLGAVA
jgi:hypothetical protein